MKISFQKFDGAGNDFVVIDNRRRLIRHPARTARQVCDRHRGIGADGMLLVERSSRADFRMMYYNADGSYGGMCGNGGRCIALFAYLNGIVGKVHRFEALGHIYRAQILPKGQVRLAMKDPAGLRTGLALKGPHGHFKAHFLDTGSPHTVIELKRGGLSRLDLKAIGPWIRRHPLFQPKGTNANFIERIGPRSLKMRTYERGVEAETLACGTGSVACALIASHELRMKGPVVIHTASGDRMTVSFDVTRDGYRNVTLEGPARRSFKGVVDVPTT